MPIVTTNVKAITDSEIARANSLETLVARLTATVDEQALEIARLRALIATPPVTPPATPPTGRNRLYVDGRQLKTKNGTPFVNRGIELMYFPDDVRVGPAGICALVAALGANSIAPLPFAETGTIAHAKAFCDAARAAGQVCWFNFDHYPNGRAAMNTPEMVALLNGYDHVGLECEVETAEVSTDAQWVAGATSLVQSARAAGHKSVLKVGAPQGGRRVEFPLRAGAQVLAADPEKQIVFTWQAYWGKTGTWYQGQAGVVNGLAGTKAALDKIAASPLCFLIGFDWQDDGGDCDELALIDKADSLGLNWQHWALTGDGTLVGNNLIDRFDWERKLSSITANGIALQSKLLARRTLAAL